MKPSLGNAPTLNKNLIKPVLIFLILFFLNTIISTCRINDEKSADTIQSPHILQPVPITDVKVTGGFWADKLKTIYKVTLPDVLDKFEKQWGGAFTNFDMIRDGIKGKHIGPPWYDGLVYETMRAASDILCITGDKQLDKRLDGYIERIAAAAAKDPNGYINTYTQLEEPQHRWGENGGNIRWQHDVYNSGALVEAAVHHYLATGKVNLLSTAVKFANYMCDYIGPSPKKNIIPGHALPEESFTKLYKLFVTHPDLKNKLSMKPDERRYLELAQFWIENRGNHEGRKSLGAYAQDHKSMLEQETIEGHAVRATLAFNGMTVLAMENDRRDYFYTIQRVWENMVSKRMYITGGVGSTHQDEKFGADYYLPNDGYLETCAAVGAGFFHHNMNLAFANAKYANELERVLYNNILSGVSSQGNRYFYQNSLETNKGKDRWSWHGCPCCPPMLLKILAAMPGYIYAHDGNGIYVNLYVDSKAFVLLDNTRVDIRQETEYPWEGQIKIKINPDQEANFAVNLRVPSWSKKIMVKVNSDELTDLDMYRGYVSIDRRWNKGDIIEILIPMSIRKEIAHPAVENNLGRLALMRGPIVYCAEGVDNGGDVFDLIIPDSTTLRSELGEDILSGLTVLRGNVLKDKGPGSTREIQEFLAIPYFAWANRESSDMIVWLTSDKMVYPPKISPKSTIFLEQIEIQMKNRNNDEIRYTLDGSIPSQKSNLYTQPIVLTDSTIVTAIAYSKEGTRSVKCVESFNSTSYMESRLSIDALVHGVNFDYYEQKWQERNNFENLSPLKSGTSSFIDLSPREKDKNFGFRFTGFIKIPHQGIYTFYTRSDDGSELYISNRRIVDNVGFHLMKEVRGQVALKAGIYPFEILYYQGGGNFGLEVHYEGPVIKKQLILSEILFRMKKN